MKIFKKIETSKILALYLLTLLTGILVYALWIMYYLSDISALPTVITDIAAQILVYAVYCLKSYKAKSSEEEMKFKRDKFAAMLEAAAKNKKNTGIESLDDYIDDEDDECDDEEEENNG